MEERTTIQITRNTLKRLKTFKIVEKESYEELLNRFMDEKIGKGSKEWEKNQIQNISFST